MTKPGLFKRLLIAIYDGLLMVAVVIVTSFVLIAALMALTPELFYADPAAVASMDINNNPAVIERSDTGRMIGGILICANAIVVSFVFYGWFWTHGGQTLGMRAWNLYLIKPDGKFINWKTAAVRYLSAILSWAAIGIGFTWILLDRKKRTWHDIISGTQIVFVPKDKQ